MQRFNLVHYFAHASWYWFIFVDRCAICRNDLNEPSIEYHEELCGLLSNINRRKVLYSQSVAMGKCKHSYHLDCIETWLNNNLTCPLCSREWEYFKILNLCFSNN